MIGLNTLLAPCFLMSLTALAAFTRPVQSSSSSIQQNAAGTWCFYPASPYRQLKAACVANDAELAPVIEAHVAQGQSISYYSPSLQRLGGVEYPVGSSVGTLYLCISGRALDGTYVTQCEDSKRDNEFNSFYGRCALEIAQREVTDGCYEPGLPKPATVPTTARGPAAPGSTTKVDLPITGAAGGKLVEGSVTISMLMGVSSSFVGYFMI